MGRPSASPLRLSLKLAYANGAMWGAGSGLASVSLIAYFARELHASGTAVAWILAAPSLAGMLRLGTPFWLHRVASRRRFSVMMFLASAATLALLSIVAAPGCFADPAWSLVALGSAWSIAQTLEFVAVVSHGLVQSPRQIFMASVLRLALAEKRSLDAASRGGQILLMPWLGKLVDRRGNVRLLIVSWSVVSLATLFFFIVTPAARWLIVGAYVCWIAYAGLMLGLSPRESTASYAAA